MQDYTYAYFFIEGFDCNHEEITRLVGLTPTEAWNKGETNKKTGRIRKDNCWELYSPLSRDETFIDKHIDAILKILHERKDQIIEMTSKYNCRISCVGSFFSPNPAFDLSKESIKQLAEYNIPIEFDLYCNCSKCAKDELGK